MVEFTPITPRGGEGGGHIQVSRVVHTSFTLFTLKVTGGATHILTP